MSVRGATAAGPFASTNNVGPAVQGGLRAVRAVLGEPVPTLHNREHLWRHKGISRPSDHTGGTLPLRARLAKQARFPSLCTGITSPPHGPCALWAAWLPCLFLTIPERWGQSCKHIYVLQ